MAKIGVREWMAVGRVIASGQLARYGGGDGGSLEEFEHRLAVKLGVEHALTVNSGTSALICALVGAGVGPGDEVLVPAYTWIATAAAPLAVGAVPVLVDINETLTIDPDDIIRKIGPSTVAVIPVHIGNAVCDMDRIMNIAQQHDLSVIEDACQAVGASYKQRRVGSVGEAGALSFNQFKNINVGEGGAVVCNDDKVFERARMYHDAGAAFRGHQTAHDEPAFVGVNMKVSQIMGAMLNVQLSKLDPLISRLRKRRQLVADILSRNEAFRICPHNDIENAISLHVAFAAPEAAESFAIDNRGVHRLYDSSRHVFTNWKPVLERRMHHPGVDPFSRTKRDVGYHEDVCRRSIDILKRSCRIDLVENRSSSVALALAHRLAKWNGGVSG